MTPRKRLLAALCVDTCKNSRETFGGSQIRCSCSTLLKPGTSKFGALGDPGKGCECRLVAELLPYVEHLLCFGGWVFPKLGLLKLLWSQRAIPSIVQWWSWDELGPSQPLLASRKAPRSQCLALGLCFGNIESGGRTGSPRPLP